jgi:hypothetical protein
VQRRRVRGDAVRVLERFTRIHAQCETKIPREIARYGWDQLVEGAHVHPFWNWNLESDPPRVEIDHVQ